MEERVYLSLGCKLPFLYLEKGALTQHNYTLYFWYENNSYEVPIGSIAVLFIGPGVKVTHSAIKIITRNNCLAVWVGEGITRSYAMCIREDRSSANIDKQIKIHTKNYQKLLKRYAEKRLNKKVMSISQLTPEKIRGIEGSIMRKAYQEYALKYGVPYSGRKVSGEWDEQTEYNRSISLINSYLYGISCACIVGMGYLPALGILHSGHMLSLVFDIADLYKIDISLRFGFECSSLLRSGDCIESYTRAKVMDYLVKEKIMDRVISDIEELYDGSCYRI